MGTTTDVTIKNDTGNYSAEPDSTGRFPIAIRDSMGDDLGTSINPLYINSRLFGWDTVNSVWQKIKSYVIDAVNNVSVLLVGLYDPISNNVVEVSADRRLLVSQEVSAPPNTTRVRRYIFRDIFGNSFLDHVWVIPSGKTVRLQKFTASFEDPNKSSKAELWYDPLGNGTNMKIIAVIHGGGNSAHIDLNDEFVGDGTAAIRMRATGMDVGTREIFCRWQGYYS